MSKEKLKLYNPKTRKYIDDGLYVVTLVDSEGYVRFGEIIEHGTHNEFLEYEVSRFLVIDER